MYPYHFHDGNNTSARLPDMTFNAIKNSAGGNCLFLSLLHAMLHVNPSSVNPIHRNEFESIVQLLKCNNYYIALMKLRSIIASELYNMYDHSREVFPIEFCDFQSASRDVVERHVQALVQEGEWGESVDLVAWSFRYGINVNMVYDGQVDAGRRSMQSMVTYSPPLAEPSNGTTSSVYIRVDYNTQHFECLLLQDSNDEPASLSSLIQRSKHISQAKEISLQKQRNKLRQKYPKAVVNDHDDFELPIKPDEDSHTNQVTIIPGSAQVNQRQPDRRSKLSVRKKKSEGKDNKILNSDKKKKNEDKK